MRAFHLAIAGLLLSAGGAAQAASLSFSGLYVFGDSLVDSGNAQIGSIAAGGGDPTPAAAGYVGGRFSNGPTFADYLNISISGTPATPSLLGGTDYAFGGAQTAYSPTEESPSFAEQLGLFGNRTIAGDALVLVTFGGNDVRATLGQPAADFTAATDAFGAGLGRLIAAGARNFVVTGVPDIGRLPSVTAFGSAGLEAQATARSAALSASIRATTQTLGAQSGANFSYFDFTGFQDQVLGSPAAYGLPAALNTTDPCQSDAVALATGCTGYLVFDDVHPTTHIHGLIADAIAGQLIGAVPEPATWAMMTIGFGAVGASLRRRRTRLLAA